MKSKIRAIWFANPGRLDVHGPYKSGRNATDTQALVSAYKASQETTNVKYQYK